MAGRRLAARPCIRLHFTPTLHPDPQRTEAAMSGGQQQHPLAVTGLKLWGIPGKGLQPPGRILQLHGPDGPVSLRHALLGLLAEQPQSAGT